MKPYISLGLLIIFPLLQSCGMFGTAEPEIPVEQPAVSEASTAESQEEPKPTVEEIETLKDEEHRQEIEAKEEKLSLISEICWDLVLMLNFDLQSNPNKTDVTFSCSVCSENGFQLATKCPGELCGVR